MKTYWSIPGPSQAPNASCIAFYKYDGSQIRAEWSRKKGWYKFGTRKQIIDESNEYFGPAIPTFLQTYSDSIPKIFKDNKKYRGIESATVYCEYFSKSSIGCFHNYEELHNSGEVVLFDVNINKKGFVVPRDFVKDFGHIKSAQVVYEGNFNKQFVKDVWDGKYPVREGVVAKGILNNSSHSLWMAKCKTKQWIEDIKNLLKPDDPFLLDNLVEQEQ